MMDWRIERYPMIPRSRRHDGYEVRLTDLGVWGVFAPDGTLLCECEGQREGETWVDTNCPMGGSR